MRKLAVDLGDVRIGLAMSDTLGIMASPYETYKAKTLSENVSYIARIVIENNCDTVVVGYPINMDGTIGDRALGAEKFAELLDKELNESIDIVLQDERLTTTTAEELLIEVDMKREERKKVIDQVAACIILEQFLKTLK